MLGRFLCRNIIFANDYSNDTIMEKKDKIEKAREMLKQKSANKRGELDENKLLERYSSIITMQREIDTLAVTIQMLKQDLETSESGSHLLDVQEKLQKFQIQESQV